MGCITLVRCMLMLRCGLAVVVWYPYAGFSLYTDTTPHDAHPSQLHSQQRTLAQHDMLPQHPVYRNELNCECFNVTLARKKRSSLRMI